jgi:hypothetical protein
LQGLSRISLPLNPGYAGLHFSDITPHF